MSIVETGVSARCQSLAVVGCADARVIAVRLDYAGRGCIVGGHGSEWSRETQRTLADAGGAQ